MSAESIFHFDSDQDPNVLFRAAHSYSHKLWHNPFNRQSRLSPNLYVHTYAEVGKAILDEAELIGSVDARIGRSSEMSGKLYLSPFFYVLSNGYKNDDKGDAHYQSGLGLAVDYFSGYHRYKGYRQRTEFLMRVGVDLNRKGENPEVNGLLGLRWTFF